MFLFPSALVNDWVGADVEDFFKISGQFDAEKGLDVWEFQMQLLEINKSLSRWKGDNCECK